MEKARKEAEEKKALKKEAKSSDNISNNSRRTKS
jgi:hypothetical protein